MSKTDTIKTISTFNKLDVPIFGYIENMTLPLSVGEELTFNNDIPKITTISFNENIYNMTFSNTSNELNNLKSTLKKIINV